MVFSRILTWRVSRRRWIRWRQCWMSFKGRLRRLDDKLERVKAVRGRTKEWPADPVEFCVQYLGFRPTVYQEKLLQDPAQFIVARWSRQSGKTHCVAVLLLWSCLRTRGFNVIVLAPAVRQSKIIIRKITNFLPKLPKYVALKPLKTKIEFSNGSRIQAFPNSPETIRGEPGVNLLYADEFSYIKDDKELYEAAIFSLATTNGRFLATSTPGSRESMFYAMCTDDVNFFDFSRHHVSYLDALEPNGPLKLLNENLHDLRRIMIDQTGVGETFMSMAISSGLKNARGIVLSQPKKQDVMTFLKHCMEDGLVHIPYDREFMNELNLERFGLEATGKLKFSHPPGTHDDRLWAFALAVYYARLQPTEYHPVAAVNKYPRPGNLCPQLPRSLWQT